MNLESEALVAVSGLFPEKPVGPGFGNEARLLPGRWRSEVKRFFDADKPERFRLPRRPYENSTMVELLTEMPDTIWLASRIADPMTVDGYLSVLNNAREYVRAQWPILKLNTFTGERIVEPGAVSVLKAYNAFDIANSPARILDEMMSGSVDIEHTACLRTVYPNLFEMLLDMLDERKILEVARVKSYEIPWWKERVIRIIYNIPPEMSLEPAASEPPRFRQPEHEPINIRFNDANTRGERIAAK